ncbi:MAG: SURF1 family protein [Betaproteobacteria bacterium]
MIVSRIIQDIKKRPIAFIAMLCLVVLGVELGLWQLRRATVKIEQAQAIHEKANLPALIASEKSWTQEQALYHRMQATGYWIAEEGIWLANRPHPLGKDPKTGIATGFNLLMPLRLDAKPEMTLWVNRGWVPRSFQQMNEVPSIRTNKEKVSIEGIVFPNSGKTYQLSSETLSLASDGIKIQENHVLSEKEAFSEHVLPFVVRMQNSPKEEGLDQTLPAMITGVNTHYGYAFQWFGLAVMTFLYWVFTTFRKRSQSLR